MLHPDSPNLIRINLILCKSIKNIFKDKNIYQNTIMLKKGTQEKGFQEFLILSIYLNNSFLI